MSSASMVDRGWSWREIQLRTSSGERQDANLKITGVISDVMGMSHRAMIEAIIEGQQEPERLADLSQGRLKASRPAVVAALRGLVTPHHRFLLRLHLQQIDALEAAVCDVERAWATHSRPFRPPSIA
jgi:hypothetical protein